MVAVQHVKVLILFHPPLSGHHSSSPASTLPFLTQTISLSSFTMIFLYSPAFFLLPGSSISSILFAIHPLSHVRSCPNHHNLDFITPSPNRTPSAVPLICSFLILSILVSPSENFNCIFQLTILSLRQCHTVSKVSIIEALNPVIYTFSLM